MIESDAMYEGEYNCLTTDLVLGYPPTTTGYKQGSKMYAWDGTTKELSSIFKLVLGSWMKL